jgi:16S rRNA (cytosine1402-N4)-methyltransferase
MADNSSKAPHYSVLYRETLDGLNLKPGGRYIDGTLGAGGHSYGILTATAPDGKLLGLDVDDVALSLAGQRLAEFGERVRLVKSNFAEIAEVVGDEAFDGADGVVLDLGVSSMQLDDPARGFSFRADGPLDMRLGEVQGKTTAAVIVNTWREEDLARIFFELGEEPQGRRFARAIVEARKDAQPGATKSQFTRRPAFFRRYVSPLTGNWNDSNRVWRAQWTFCNRADGLR